MPDLPGSPLRLTTKPAGSAPIKPPGGAATRPAFTTAPKPPLTTGVRPPLTTGPRPAPAATPGVAPAPRPLSVVPPRPAAAPGVAPARIVAAPGAAPVRPAPVPAGKLPTGEPALALRRRGTGGTRSPFELAQASAEARKQIASVVSATRSPFGGPTQLSTSQAGTLERSLRELEMKLVEREHAMEELENRLTERERDIAEAEALLVAREALVNAARQNAPAKAAVSKEEQEALEQLKAQLDRQ